MYDISDILMRLGISAREENKFFFTVNFTVIFFLKYIS